MTYQLKIRRGEGDGESFWQTFSTPCGGEDSVACALEELNSRPVLQDLGGEDAMPVAWDCACLEKKCGACAMVIGGKPRLACATPLKAGADKNGVVTLQPLKKFPRLRDLRVDRNTMFDALRDMEIWLENEAEPDGGEEDRTLRYKAASCLMCGLCLEVCPNFDLRSDFAGALSVPAVFRTVEQSEDGEHREYVRRQYQKKFFAACAKSLSCQEICPAGIPMEQMLVKTNAAAVWRRKRK